MIPGYEHADDIRVYVVIVIWEQDDSIIQED